MKILYNFCYDKFVIHNIDSSIFKRTYLYLRKIYGRLDRYCLAHTITLEESLELSMIRQNQIRKMWSNGYFSNYLTTKRINKILIL